MEKSKKKSSTKSKKENRGTSKTNIVPTGSTKKPAEFNSSLLEINLEEASADVGLSWEQRMKSLRKDNVQATSHDMATAPSRNEDEKIPTGKTVESHHLKKDSKKAPVKKPVKDEMGKSSSSVNKSNDKDSVLDWLWDIAAASKTKALTKEKQTQVWIDTELYRKIEKFNLECGKPYPVKHIINAILKLYLDEHKAEMSKAKAR